MLSAHQPLERFPALIRKRCGRPAAGGMPAMCDGVTQGQASCHCSDRGSLAKVRSGDLIPLDARAGRLEALVEPADWAW